MMWLSAEMYLFGVVVQLETPRISDPTAFVAWRSDTICQTHLATFESAVYAAWPNTSPPKGLCQCIELHFSFAVESVGRCWAGLTNICWHILCIACIDHSWLMSPKLVLCESTDWHHQCEIPSKSWRFGSTTIAGIQRSFAWSFAGDEFTHPQRVLQLNAIALLDERETSVSYVFADWQPKKAEKTVTLDWSIKLWCAWDSRRCFANICIHLYPKMNGSMI